MAIEAFSIPELSTKRLILRKANKADAVILLNYYLANRSNFKFWEPLRNEEFYTVDMMTRRLQDMETQMSTGGAIHILIFDRASQKMLGECNFTNIIRGPFQACHLGFTIDAGSEGKGLMRESLSLAINFVFNSYGLHRIMANYRPENERSRQLLKRLGFQQEGLARSYLKINGEWSDHVLSSLVNGIDWDTQLSKTSGHN